MLSPNLDNPAMAAIAASVETALRSAGYVMILCDTHDRAELQDEYLYAMRSQLVQGYVLVNAVRSEALSASVARGDRIVFVGRRNPDGGGSFVGIDNRRAGADAADHLWTRGIRNLAIIYPTQGSSAHSTVWKALSAASRNLACPQSDTAGRSTGPDTYGGGLRRGSEAG